MTPSEIVPRLMFDYEHLPRDEMVALCGRLPRKVVRWVAHHHPDNRARLLFLELTNVVVGEGTVINPYLYLHDSYAGLVSFGRRVSVADHVTVVADSGPNNSELRHLPYVREHLIQQAPVHIGDDAWIGAHAVILPGVTVGCGAVVAAGAIVVADVEPYSVVAGVPARMIRRLYPGSNARGRDAAGPEGGDT